jgi:deoxyinosine 3'endonuclease (endonuclease V)
MKGWAITDREKKDRSLIKKESWVLSSPIRSFEVTYLDAKRIQNELREKVELVDIYTSPEEDILVGGADVAFISAGQESPEQPAEIGENTPVSSSGSHGNRSERNSHGKALAAAVTLNSGKKGVIEVSHAVTPLLFPYVPGYLTFREGPAILAAIGGLKTLPRIMLYDGSGIAHPRGLGLASHMAVLTGIPSIGCAKSLLCGECREPGSEKGDWTELWYENRVVGACLRTRKGVKPVFVSPGSGFTVKGAVECVLSLCYKYRLPEPTRIAHSLVTAEKNWAIK